LGRVQFEDSFSSLLASFISHAESTGTRWDLPGTPGTIDSWRWGISTLSFSIGVVMSIEDPDKPFWEEKRKRVH
jgi:hypothetical protein